MKHNLLIKISCMVFLLSVGCNEKLKAIHLEINPSQISVGNEKQKWVFDAGQSFRILELSSPQAGFCWIGSSGPHTDVWSLSFINKEKNTKLNTNSMQAVYQGYTVDRMNRTDTLVLTFTWSYKTSYSTEPFDIRMKVSMGDKSDLSYWWLEADMPNDWRLYKGTFLTLNTPLVIGMKTIMPVNWGVEYELKNGASFSSDYPSSRGTMQMLCLTNQREALYYATHDPDASTKIYRVTTANDVAQVKTDFTAAEDWTSSSGRFILPWSSAVGIHPEGWEAAAVNWYRPFTSETEWGAKNVRERSIPQWLTEVDLWFTPSSNSTSQDDIRAVFNYFSGSRLAFHWYYWHNYAFDTNYPEYFPAKANVKPGFDLIHEKGSHVIPYINARLWDTTTVSYSTDRAIDHVALTEGGKPYIETPVTGHPAAVMCPSSILWKEVMTDLTVRIQDELGADGVYYDQIGAASPKECWNKNHGHPVGGGCFWSQSYREMVKSLKNRIHRDNIMTTEQNTECYIDLFDAVLMATVPQGADSLRQVPLFPLVYSDRTLLYGFNFYNHVTGNAFLYKNTLSLLWGAQLGWLNPTFLLGNSVSAAERSFLRKLTQFRSLQRDLFYGGRLLQELPLGGDIAEVEVLIGERKTATKVVRAVLWESVSGKKAILLVNMSGQLNKVILPDKSLVEIPALSCLRIDVDSGGSSIINAGNIPRLSVAQYENGMLLSGLKKGDTYAVYDIRGLPVDCVKEASDANVHIPLTRKGIYVVRVYSASEGESTCLKFCS